MEQQIKIACGEKLTYGQKDISKEGHAIEARIYAEDPVTFFPSPGTITVLLMRMDDRELMKVWKERSAYEPGQIVTDDKIDHIEKAIGFRLPHIYKQLMKLQNGGEMVIPIYPDDELPFVIFIRPYSKNKCRY